MFAAIAVTLGLVAALCYEYALPLTGSRAEFLALRRLCLVLAWVVFGAAVLDLCLCSGLLPGLIDDALSGWHGALVLLAAAGASWLQIGVFSALRDQRHGPIAVARALQGLTMVGLQLGLAGVLPGATGLIVGYAGGQVVAGGLAVVASRCREREPPAALWPVVRRYRSFPLVMSWSVLLFTVGLQLPVLLIGACFGAPAAGRWLLASRLTSGAAQVVATPAAQHYYGSASSRLRDGGAGMAQLVALTACRLLAIGLVVAVVLAPLGLWGAGWVFGEEWRAAGDLLLLLLVPLVLQFAASPVSGTLSILERHGWSLAWNLVRVVAVTLAIILPWVVGADLRGAVLMVALAYSVTFALLYALVRFAVRRHGAPAGDDCRPRLLPNGVGLAS